MASARACLHVRDLETSRTITYVHGRNCSPLWRIHRVAYISQALSTTPEDLAQLDLSPMARAPNQPLPRAYPLSCVQNATVKVSQLYTHHQRTASDRCNQFCCTGNCLLHRNARKYWNIAIEPSSETYSLGLLEPSHCCLTTKFSCTLATVLSLELGISTQKSLRTSHRLFRSFSFFFFAFSKTNGLLHRAIRTLLCTSVSTVNNKVQSNAYAIGSMVIMGRFSKTSIQVEPTCGQSSVVSPRQTDRGKTGRTIGRDLDELLATSSRRRQAKRKIMFPKRVPGRKYSIEFYQRDTQIFLPRSRIAALIRLQV